VVIDPLGSGLMTHQAGGCENGMLGFLTPEPKNMRVYAICLSKDGEHNGKKKNQKVHGLSEMVQP